jgi:hypothetical protein
MRYAQDNLTGTARYRAMSGAFGALRRPSSLNVNPAGSAVFSNNQMGLTLSNYNVKNNANYFGTTTKDASNSSDLNQAGSFVLTIITLNWKKFHLESTTKTPIILITTNFLLEPIQTIL